MASRNFNFPQSYGSGVVHLPMGFRVQGIGPPPFADVAVFDQTPGDDYSATINTLGVSSGSISITTVDAFNELLSVNVDAQTVGGGDKIDIEQAQQLADGRWRFNLRQYTLQGGIFVQEYRASTIWAMMVFRNSSTKF